MKKNLKNTEGFMDFENMLRQFFGDKSYGDQAIRQNEKLVKIELHKVVLKIEKRIINLETTNRHKERMLSEIERIKNDFKQSQPDLWTINIHLFSLISRLLGYDYLKGFINTPIYCQTPSQYYSQVIFEGGDAMQGYYDKKNIISLRKYVFNFLKKDGYSDFKISQIMNTTEFEIKKLKE